MALRNIGGKKQAMAEGANRQVDIRARLADLNAKHSGYKAPKTESVWDGNSGTYVDVPATSNPYTSQIEAAQAELNAATQAAQGLNADGTPIDPGMNNIIDEQGNLLEGWKYDPTLMDTSKLAGYNRMKDIALAQGPSDWAKLMQQQNLMGKQDTVDKASTAANTGQAQALSQMAMRGGFGGGARAGLAKQSMRDLMAQRQGAQRNYLGQQLNVGTQDESMKRDMLGKFGGMEADISKFNTDMTNKGNEYNLRNRMSAMDRENSYNMDVYKGQLDKWASGKQADATARSGGGGGKK